MLYIPRQERQNPIYKNEREAQTFVVVADYFFGLAGWRSIGFYGKHTYTFSSLSGYAEIGANFNTGEVSVRIETWYWL